MCHLQIDVQQKMLTFQVPQGISSTIFIYVVRSVNLEGYKRKITCLTLYSTRTAPADGLAFLGVRPSIEKMVT